MPVPGAGPQPLTMPGYMDCPIIRMRCIGELDPIIMGRAFLNGANGLLLLGCKPETCHHSYGLDHTWSRSLMLKKLLELCGLS